MATLSLSTQKPTPHSHHHDHNRHPRCYRQRVSFPAANPRRRLLRPVAAATRIPSTPPTAPPGELYQPYRPPSSPLPAKYRALDPGERLEILRNRLGLWHEYAPLISSLARDGFTPPSIEEITGISGVEQNLLSGASQVRDSLLSSSISTDILGFFDAASGADLLYEIRLLNATQRVAAAIHMVNHRFDPKAAQELARAIKIFPRRRGEKGWECFSGDSPGDCLAYTDFRLSREVIAEGERIAVLERAMEAAETDRAKSRVLEEMQKIRKGGAGEGVEEEEEEKVAMAAVPVVKLKYGEISEATTVVVLPVCRASEGKEELDAAPRVCKREGEMGVVSAERGWGRWVVLPGWGPAAAVAEKGGVAVEICNWRALPWRKDRWGKEETVVVVVDRKGKEVAADGFYLVEGGEEKGLVVERGRKILEMGRTAALGTVVMVVRPPFEEDEDKISDEEWE